MNRQSNSSCSTPTLADASRVLTDSELAEEMADHNFLLARRHYSYAMLERHLQTVLAECFGEEY